MCRSSVRFEKAKGGGPDHWGSYKVGGVAPGKKDKVEHMCLGLPLKGVIQLKYFSEAETRNSE